MNSLTKFVAAGIISLAIAGSVTACSDSQPDADVLQYGSYDTMHVYHVYPQPVLVHVSYRVYHSDSRMYSTPSYEKTYVKTHTVTRTTTTTTTRSSGTVNKTPQDKVPTSKTSLTKTQIRTTTRSGGR